MSKVRSAALPAADTADVDVARFCDIGIRIQTRAVPIDVPPRSVPLVRLGWVYFRTRRERYCSGPRLATRRLTGGIQAGEQLSNQ